MSRLSSNFKIIKLLATAAKLNPDLRFIQLLWHLDIVNDEDRFYEESNITLEKVLEKYESNRGRN